MALIDYKMASSCRKLKLWLVPSIIAYFHLKNALKIHKLHPKCTVYSGWYLCYWFPSRWTQCCYTTMWCSLFSTWRDSSWRGNRAQYAASYFSLLQLSYATAILTSAYSGLIRSAGLRRLLRWSHNLSMVMLRQTKKIPQVVLVILFLKLSQDNYGVLYNDIETWPSPCAKHRSCFVRISQWMNPVCKACCWFFYPCNRKGFDVSSLPKTFSSRHSSWNCFDYFRPQCKKA